MSFLRLVNKCAGGSAALELHKYYGLEEYCENIIEKLYRVLFTSIIPILNNHRGSVEVSNSLIGLEWILIVILDITNDWQHRRNEVR